MDRRRGNLVIMWPANQWRACRASHTTFEMIFDFSALLTKI